MAKLNVEVSHVEFLETPKSKSTFYAWSKWDFWSNNSRWRKTCRNTISFY
jgi:hypothetical protein